MTNGGEAPRSGRARRVAVNTLVAVAAAGGVSWLWIAGERDRAADAPRQVASVPSVAAPVALVGPALRREVRNPLPNGVAGGASGGWVVPVAGVAPSTLRDTFLDGRSEGRTHRAIDVMAPRGTSVVAVADGEIVKLFTSKAGGLTIYQRVVGPAAGELAGGRPVIAYYAHLDSYAPGLAEGQVVRRGAVVGTVGFSGNGSADAPHLHFQLLVQDAGDDWSEGEPVNPYPLLAGVGAG